MATLTLILVIWISFQNTGMFLSLNSISKIVNFVDTNRKGNTK